MEHDNQGAHAAPLAHLERWALGRPGADRLHHFDVLDLQGNTVGVVKLLRPGEGPDSLRNIGVRLNWCPATVRVVSTDGMEVDDDQATVRIAYTEEQIRQAPLRTCPS